jgi:hypothetical protein
MDTFDNPDHGEQLYTTGVVDNPLVLPEDNPDPVFPSLGEGGSDTNDH